MNNRTLSYFPIMHPSVIMIYYIGIFILLFTFSNPVFLMTLFASVIILALVYAGGAPLLKHMRFFVLMVLIIMIINPLINHRGSNIIFYLGENPITLESIVYGFLSGIMILSFILIFLSFNRLITSEKFMYLFSRVLPKITFIIDMSLRFSTLFKERAMHIIAVQKTKDISIKAAGSFKEKILVGGSIMRALTAWCLEEGMSIAETLKAKEYGKNKRSVYLMYKYTKSDGICTAIQCVLLCICIALSVLSAGSYSVFPKLELPYFQFIDVLAYAAMVIFLALPLMINAFMKVYKEVYSFAFH